MSLSRIRWWSRCSVVALGAAAVAPSLARAQRTTAEPPAASPSAPTGDDVQVAPNIVQTPPALESPQGDTDKLRIEIEPVIWFAGPSGDLKLPVDSGTGPGSFTTEGDSLDVNDLNLDKTRLSPKGAFRLSFGDWQVGFSGADYSSDRETTAEVAGRLGAVPFAAGDRLDTEFGYGMYELYAGYKIWERDFAIFSQSKDDADRVNLKLYLVGGVRLQDVDIRVATTGVTPAVAHADELFVEPIVGARLETELTEHFGINLLITAGGLPLDDRSSYSIDVDVAFYFRPIPNLSIEVGYRQLAVGLESGDGLDKFEYDGRIAGLFTGLTLHF